MNGNAVRRINRFPEVRAVFGARIDGWMNHEVPSGESAKVSISKSLANGSERSE